MKFTIVERKMKIDDDLRAYALRKVEKLDRYFQQDSDTTLTFSELRGKQTVEVTVRQVGLVVRAEETTSDMFASVDGAVSSIERQIRKHKTRLEKRLREGAFDKIAEQQAAFAEDDFAAQLASQAQRRQNRARLNLGENGAERQVIQLDEDGRRIDAAQHGRKRSAQKKHANAKRGTNGTVQAKHENPHAPKGKGGQGKSGKGGSKQGGGRGKQGKRRG